ncbi:MAG: hypothetical protein J6L86_03790 [Alphaproteobacteria bacterium]|nr:hypothetical protein [Alphaproteobacteria bacterium]
MSDYLNKTAAEIGKSRKEVIDRLVVFSQTDMLLFWGHEKDLIERQEKVWGPILQWANNEINVEFVKTQGLDVPENKASGEKLRDYLNSFSDKELAAFYVAALNMKSVLLAIALVKKRLSAEEAFNAAFLDELWQAESWGVEKEAEKRRSELKKELHEVEDFLK